MNKFFDMVTKKTGRLYLLIPLYDLFVPLIIMLSAYVIFGIAGFGTALVAAPLLAFYLPVSKIIPFLSYNSEEAAGIAALSKIISHLKT